MNHITQYRSVLPHQLHPSHCPPLQNFSGRFPTVQTLTDNPNAILIPTIGREGPTPYHGPLQPFLPDNRQHPIDSTTKITDIQRKHIDSRTFPVLPVSERQRENCSEDHRPYKPTTSTPATGDRQFVQHCSQGAKNCALCYKAATPRIMVDAATMTDNEEMDQLANNWQGLTAPSGNKVAEYLTSLRQFLKLQSPSEPGQNKRRLGDVRIVTSSDGSRLYCCPECHMAYPDKTLLEPHLAVHKIERRFICNVCGAGLKRKEHLDRHQLSHSEERPYSCAACPKTFKRNEHLARHYVIHSGEKAQVCTECGKGFYRRDHLRKHTQGHLTKRLRMAAKAVVV